MHGGGAIEFPETMTFDINSGEDVHMLILKQKSDFRSHASVFDTTGEIDISHWVTSQKYIFPSVSYMYVKFYCLIHILRPKRFQESQFTQTITKTKFYGKQTVNCFQAFIIIKETSRFLSIIYRNGFRMHFYNTDLQLRCLHMANYM